MVRVMLSAIEDSGYSIEQLGYDFVRSSREHQGSLNGFLMKLDILRRVTADGAFGFSLEELEDYLTEYQKAAIRWCLTVSNIGKPTDLPTGSC